MMTTPAEMVAQYIKLRDYRKACDEEYSKSMERVKQAMEKLEGQLLLHLQQSGTSNIGCDAGIAYRNTKTSVSVDSPSAFLNYVRDNDAWDALDLKANKTFVEAMIKESGGSPPGVKVSSVHTVGIRKATRKEA